MLMVVGGCIIAGAGDLGFDLLGYTLSVGSCMVQVSGGGGEWCR